MSADDGNACQYVRLPNAETVEALDQAQTGTKLVEYLTLEELKAKA